METLTDIFQALGEENRLRIVNLLLDTDELCVCDIERVLAVPQPRVSRHLVVLKQAGIVVARRNGLWMHYRLVRDTPLKRALYRELRSALSAVPKLTADIRALHGTTLQICIPKSARRTLAANTVSAEADTAEEAAC